MRGILEAGGPSEEKIQKTKEDSSTEEEAKLEPEKEKNTPGDVDRERCSMEVIANRWRDKPKQMGAASAYPQATEDRGQSQWPLLQE